MNFRVKIPLLTRPNKRHEKLVIKLTAQVDQLQKMVKNLEDKN